MIINSIQSAMLNNRNNYNRQNFGMNAFQSKKNNALKPILTTSLSVPVEKLTEIGNVLIKPIKTYHPNGKLKSKLKLVGDVVVNESSYSDDGTLLYLKTYDPRLNKKNEKFHYSDGQLSTESETIGDIEVKYASYKPDGTPSIFRTYDLESKIFIQNSYHQNGKLEREFERVGDVVVKDFTYRDDGTMLTSNRAPV